VLEKKEGEWDTEMDSQESKKKRKRVKGSLREKERRKTAKG